MTFNVKGSVTVVALVAVTLLFLLVMVVSSLVEVGFLQTERYVQKTKTRWFLEGEVARWFAQWTDSHLPFEGKWTFSSLKGELYWRVGPTNWFLRGMAGDGISRSEIYLEGVVYPLFFSTVFWVFPVKGELHAPWEVRGNVAIGPQSFLSTNTYPWKIEGSIIVGGKNIGGDIPGVKITVFPEMWEKKIDFTLLWERAKKRVEDPWYIKTEGGRYVRNVVNPLHSSKVLLSSGQITMKIPFPWQEKIQVYVRRKDFTNGEWENFLYYKGPQKGKVVSVEEESNLKLLLSLDPYLRENPPQVDLPREAWDRFGEIVLEGKEVSLISRDEEVLAFRVGGRYYFSGTDFVYHREKKSIHITSAEFFRRHTMDIAVANGVSREYAVPWVRGDVVVYLDNQRVWNYRRTPTKIVFDVPPPPGSRIRFLLGVGDFVVYKKAPSVDQGVFVDKVERCVVLDLDGIENWPRNGIVYAKIPLIVRGRAREPIAIIGEDSLYLESINVDGGEPIVVASKTGVWLLQENSFSQTLRNVIVISPLAGLYTVGELFVPATIEGLGIFAVLGPTTTLQGFMEHTFVSFPFEEKKLPLLREFSRPLVVRRLWRR